jgi:hypothetical protein
VRHITAAAFQSSGSHPTYLVQECCLCPKKGYPAGDMERERWEARHESVLHPPERCHSLPRVTRAGAQRAYRVRYEIIEARTMSFDARLTAVECVFRGVRTCGARITRYEIAAK